VSQSPALGRSRASRGRRSTLWLALAIGQPPPPRRHPVGPRRKSQPHRQSTTLTAQPGHSTAPPLLPRRLVADRRRRGPVPPGADTHHPLPLPGCGDPHTVGEHDLIGRPPHGACGEPARPGQRARPVREAGRRNGPAETLAPRCGPTSQLRARPGDADRGVRSGRGQCRCTHSWRRRLDRRRGRGAHRGARVPGRSPDRIEGWGRSVSCRCASARSQNPAGRGSCANSAFPRSPIACVHLQTSSKQLVLGLKTVGRISVGRTRTAPCSGRRSRYAWRSLLPPLSGRGRRGMPSVSQFALDEPRAAVDEPSAQPADHRARAR
jgi:hypothetical protein